MHLPVSDVRGMTENLLQRAAYLEASRLEFLSTGEVFATVDVWRGRLDANSQDGKFEGYRLGIEALAALASEITVTYSGIRGSGQYRFRIAESTPEQIVLESLPKP